MVLELGFGVLKLLLEENVQFFQPLEMSIIGFVLETLL